MASTLAAAITPDTVMTFEINPGALLKFLESRAEGGPRLKCFEGSVTLVSPGLPHESKGARLNLLLVAVCFGLGIRLKCLGSTTWKLPLGLGDTAYEADEAYYIQSHGRAKAGYRPDLAIEIVVTHPEDKALRAGAFLKIPELWVYNIPKDRLAFYQLAERGKYKGTYRPISRSRAIPVLTPAEILERLDDPESDDPTFQDNCRIWAREVLLPRLRGGD
jgi:Uma2 family endonuclease